MIRPFIQSSKEDSNVNKPDVTPAEALIDGSVFSCQSFIYSYCSLITVDLFHKLLA